MKKLILVIFPVIMVLFLTACGAKTAITPQEFQSAMEQMGYQFVDISAQYEAGITAYLAIKSDSSYQIEYYQVASVDSAAQAFAVNRADFETMQGGSSAYVESSGENYAKYALTANDTYYYVSYIDNTMVYATAPSSAKDEVKAAFDAIGY
jgi:hypothetical protein